MENQELILSIFFIIAGAFSILASVLNWDFFFTNRKAYIFVEIFGRNGARIFYALLGSALIFFAIKILVS